MYTQQLQLAGLTTDQAHIYELLLKRGSVPASRLAKESPFSRPLVYKLLGDLIELGLVEKHDEAGSVTRFSVAHPLSLRSLIDAKRQSAESAHLALESVITKLVTDFTAQSGQPGVRILEGVGGVAELYEDILNEQVPIKLLRSYRDAENPELSSVVAKQIAEQVKLGITTTTITPLTNETHEELTNWDPAHLVTRRLVHLENFKLPAQIVLYGNKVGLTAYGTPLMTTIIENKAIAATFAVLFELLWQQVEESDKEIRLGLQEGTIVASQ